MSFDMLNYVHNQPDAVLMMKQRLLGRSLYDVVNSKSMLTAISKNLWRKDENN